MCSSYVYFSLLKLHGYDVIFFFYEVGWIILGFLYLLIFCDFRDFLVSLFLVAGTAQEVKGLQCYSLLLNEWHRSARLSSGNALAERGYNNARDVSK